jgi:2,4-dienoyl-CoA reductase-like NADH-dependent reductase (Old Yellow Enzyme family)
MSCLFSSLQAGDLSLANRIVLAPLTRCRAVDRRIPNALMVEYYRQRASAGMILTEATAIAPMAVGYANTPGIWTEEQVEGWKAVIEAIHEAGGTIVLQLWHVGRVSDPVFLDGQLPVAPSAIAQPGMITRIGPEKPYVTPRALETGEIPEVVEQYRNAAKRAREAGFDGVEIHGANGYLIDQFLHAASNQRVDAYGGSLENRMRFALEVTDAVCEVWPASRVGMHLAPRGDEADAERGDGKPLFLALCRELGKRKLAFLCCREPQSADWMAPELKEAFGGVYIANQEFTRESAEAVIEQGKVDAVAFGRAYIANPDLPERFRAGADLNDPDASTFYGDGPKGYTDYPSMG